MCRYVGSQSDKMSDRIGVLLYYVLKPKCNSTNSWLSGMLRVVRSVSETPVDRVSLMNCWNCVHC
jgi:hypothetical protein